MNNSFIAEIQEKVEKLRLYVKTDESGYDTVNGVHPDAGGLLSQLAGQFYQCIPVYEDV